MSGGAPRFEALRCSPGLKTEFYNRRPWPIKHEAATAVGRWLEERCNRPGRHSAIPTPVQFEQHHQTVNQSA